MMFGFRYPSAAVLSRSRRNAMRMRRHGRAAFFLNKISWQRERNSFWATSWRTYQESCVESHTAREHGVGGDKIIK